MPTSDTEANSGSTYTAGDADNLSSSSESAATDDGLSQNSEGIDSQNGQAETLEPETYLQEIVSQNQAIISTNLVLVVAVFLCFGAMCVETLIRSFEVK